MLPVMKFQKYIYLLFVFCCFVSHSGYAQDQFFHEATGFQIKKPPSWHYLTDQQNRDNLGQVILRDKEFQEALVKHASVPLVAMTKYPEPYNDLNPSVKVGARPYGALKDQDAKTILALGILPIKNLLQDFVIIDKPADTLIAGERAAYGSFRYSMKMQTGEVFDTHSKMWIIKRDGYYMMIGGGHKYQDQSGAVGEVEQIIKSINFSK